MYRVILLFLIALLIAGMVPAFALAEDSSGVDEILTITSFDGVQFDGRLRLPEGDAVDTLVVFVNGSGPNTYDNRRSLGDIEFRYHDLFANELNARGVGYFSYNTRGVTPGDEPPLYCEIDDELFKTYKPSNEIKDIPYIINQLKTLAPLTEAKILLLGWSAGAIIAPQAALAGEAQIDGLILAGYPNSSMADILSWQQSGGSSMVFYRQYFDTDGDGAIDQTEYEADPHGIVPALGDLPFAQLDLTGDGALTAEDFGQMLEASREEVFRAFETGDDEWLKTNYGVYLTSGWYQDYANIEPNASALPKLDLPIFILQGTYDQNTPVEGAREIEQTFKALNKENLTVQIYEADHDLNYLEAIVTGELPQPFVDLFALCAAF